MAFKFETANERWSWFKGIEPPEDSDNPWHIRGEGDPIEHLQSLAPMIDEALSRRGIKPALVNYFQILESQQDMHSTEGSSIFDQIIKYMSHPMITEDNSIFSRAQREGIIQAIQDAKEYWDLEDDRMAEEDLGSWQQSQQF
jgi:hypothetical protein